MEALLASIFIVLISELGDKTQLLSLFLAARYPRPLPIIAGILLATILNHLLAAELGQLLATYIRADYLQWGLAITFIIMGLWILVPDTLDQTVNIEKGARLWLVFWKTLTLFFIAEVGDKTQIATAMLAIEYNHLYSVVVGSTIGMMLANIPAVLLGEWLSRRMYIVSKIRYVAALIFILIGILSIINIQHNQKIIPSSSHFSVKDSAC